MIATSARGIRSSRRLGSRQSILVATGRLSTSTSSIPCRATVLALRRRAFMRSCTSSWSSTRRPARIALRTHRARCSGLPFGRTGTSLEPTTVPRIRSGSCTTRARRCRTNTRAPLCMRASRSFQLRPCRTYTRSPARLASSPQTFAPLTTSASTHRKRPPPRPPPSHPSLLQPTPRGRSISRRRRRSLHHPRRSTDYCAMPANSWRTRGLMGKPFSHGKSG
mmetsp:Transcript_23014/g.74523  ORF Transcript_23014/g.74523 Transcript_23014/m.74523 type:complete len:222 (+) Transcript_23014:638-1303(+)